MTTKKPPRAKCRGCAVLVEQLNAARAGAKEDRAWGNTMLDSWLRAERRAENWMLVALGIGALNALLWAAFA